MTDLPRKLSFFDGAALLVGSVIGSGIFVVPSLIAQRVPEPGLVIGIWIFSGLLVLCGALTLAELGAMLPQSGGLYVYMREAYGPFWAFLYGWTIMLVAIPGVDCGADERVSVVSEAVRADDAVGRENCSASESCWASRSSTLAAPSKARACRTCSPC